MSFLDEKCIDFDGEDENRLEHTGIHNVSLSTLKCRNSKRWWKGFSKN